MPLSRSITTLDKNLFNSGLYSRIHALWFAEVPQGATVASEPSLRKWFYNPNEDEKKAFDRTCSTDFSAALSSIAPTRLQLPPFTNLSAERQQAHSLAGPLLPEIEIDGTNRDEETAASNALSLVLLLDQMSRNIFRDNQHLIYSHYDRLSQALIHLILAGKPRLDLHPLFGRFPVYRMWFYMPLMHSEHLDDHIMFDKLFLSMKAEMAHQDDAAAVGDIERTLDFEKKHVDIIERFGRYPYRNSVMQRETTEAEQKWLDEGGDKFGT